MRASLGAGGAGGGLFPLHTAVKNNDVIALNEIISDGGVDVDGVNMKSLTPLYCAANKGYLDCCAALLESKADPNKPDENGWTPLHEAAYSGHLECVKVIITWWDIASSVVLMCKFIIVWYLTATYCMQSKRYCKE